jgi:hypothetical protein
MRDLEMFIETELRDWLLEYFPCLEFFEEPVTDESILGVALVDDKGPNWVTVYDDYKVRLDFFGDVVDSDSDDYEIKYSKFIENCKYNGENTPVLVIDTMECFGLRGNQQCQNYIMLDDIASLQEAYNIIDKDTMLYVPLDSIDQVSNYV